MRINAILGSLINDTHQRLTRFFGPLGLIDRLLIRLIRMAEKGDVPRRIHLLQRIDFH